MFPAVQLIELRDRATILAALQCDPLLHLYEIGDLDDFFFPHTRWFALEPGGPVALIYKGGETVVLLALARQKDYPKMAALLERVAEGLPAATYAHLSPGLLTPAFGAFEAEPQGLFLKMALTSRDRLAGAEASGGSRVVRLGPPDRHHLEALYRDAYPKSWFDPRMLETQQYHGLQGDHGGLLAAAGVHVYSKEHGVAALGNIATHPSHRGRGFAGMVTAAVCRSLLMEGVEQIGLNVKASNVAAIACYARLGFTEVAPYEEVRLRR